MSRFPFHLVQACFNFSVIVVLWWSILLLPTPMAKQLASLGQWISPISSQLIVSKVRLSQLDTLPTSRVCPDACQVRPGADYSKSRHMLRPSSASCGDTLHALQFKSADAGKAVVTLLCSVRQARIHSPGHQCTAPVPAGAETWQPQCLTKRGRILDRGTSKRAGPFCTGENVCSQCCLTRVRNLCVLHKLPCGHCSCLVAVVAYLPTSSHTMHVAGPHRKVLSLMSHPSRRQASMFAPVFMSTGEESTWWCLVQLTSATLCKHETFTSWFRTCML